MFRGNQGRKLSCGRALLLLLLFGMFLPLVAIVGLSFEFEGSKMEEMREKEDEGRRFKKKAMNKV